MVIIKHSSDYISHHGVDGQKWGVRNGPPYPLDRETLKKGTKVYGSKIDKQEYKHRTRPEGIGISVTKDKAKKRKGIKSYAQDIHAIKLKEDINLPSKEDVIKAYDKAVKSLDLKAKKWFDKELGWERDYQEVEFGVKKNSNEAVGKHKSKYENILDYLNYTSMSMEVEKELKKGGFGGMYTSSSAPYLKFF